RSAGNPNTPPFPPRRSSDLEPYHPHEPSHRERLDAALAGGASAPQDAVLFSIRAFPFQEGNLDQLAAEREIHGRRRNLVVAATGDRKSTRLNSSHVKTSYAV